MRNLWKAFNNSTNSKVGETLSKQESPPIFCIKCDDIMVLEKGKLVCFRCGAKLDES